MDSEEGTRDFWRLLVSFLVPPVGVWMQVGLTPQFWLNLVLSVLLLWVGGQVHAVYVITTTDESGGEQEGGIQRFVAILLSAFLPPIGVLVTRGLSVELLLNVLLTALCGLPGSIHALWLITHTDQP